MSITYQQAKRIRKTGVMSLFADQLMYEKKVTTAIRKTISLKTRGKIMGLTQYLDPLNIAKMMTFGSALGPALLGHWMGRDPRDIQYFTGRLKPIRERDKTGDKITKLSGTGASGTGEMSVILRKMYKLMATTHEENIKRLELSKNRDEERQLEDERRHKELLDALGGLGGTTTVTKIEKEKPGGGLFDTIRGMISDAIKKLMDGWQWLTDLSKTIKDFFTSSLFSSLLRGALRIASPRMFASFLIGAAPLLIMYQVAQWAQDAKLFDENGNPTTEFNILDEIQKFLGGRGITPEASKSKAQRILDEGSMWQSDKPFVKKWMDRQQQGVVITQAEAAALKERYNIQWPTNLIEEEQKPSVTRQFTMPPEPAQEARSEFAKTDPRLLTNSPVSEQLNTAVTENVDTKINALVSKQTPSTEYNNTTVNSQSDKTIPMNRPIPSVRMQEPEFQNRIFSNTIPAN